MKAPVRVAVTGAAGQISYSLLFRIASGEMLGADQPVILQLLEITPALKALEGVVMEIRDCAYPLVHDIVTTDDVNVAFKDVSYAMLVGAQLTPESIPEHPKSRSKGNRFLHRHVFSMEEGHRH